jgi:hypothetical protein
MGFIIGTPHTHNSGYLHTNQEPGRKEKEADIQICSHCEAVIEMQKWRDNGAWCSKCGKPVCADGTACAATTAKVGCVPYVKKLEQLLESNEQRRQLRRLLGT